MTRQAVVVPDVAAPGVAAPGAAAEQVAEAGSRAVAVLRLPVNASSTKLDLRRHFETWFKNSVGKEKPKNSLGKLRQLAAVTKLNNLLGDRFGTFESK